MAGNMGVRTLLKTKGWFLVDTPRDGHCLLHATCLAYNNANPQAPINLDYLVDCLRIETEEKFPLFRQICIDDPYIELHRCVRYKVWNQPLVDLVPFSLSNQLNVTVYIVTEETRGVCVVQHLPRYAARHGPSSKGSTQLHYCASSGAALQCSHAHYVNCSGCHLFHTRGSSTKGFAKEPTELFNSCILGFTTENVISGIPWFCPVGKLLFPYIGWCTLRPGVTPQHSAKKEIHLFFPRWQHVWSHTSDPPTPWPALQDSSTLIWGTFWQAEFLYQYEQRYKQMTWYSVKITHTFLHMMPFKPN